MRLTYDLSLPPERQSARAARRFIESCLAECDQRVRSDIMLMVSELITNAIQHAGPHDPAIHVGLHLELRDDRVRVEVSDQSPALPVVGVGDVASPSGRGLILVDQLSNRWGVERGASGKTVWVEVGR